MEVSMVTLRNGMLALALLASVAGGARASTGPVQVYGNWARGELSAAHNGGGSQYIGCWVNSDLVGPPLVYCEAADGAGSFNFCFTQNASMAAVIHSIQSTSEIVFGWATDHSCLWLTVGSSSQAPGRRP
jgi:hypothetical protein